LIVDHRLYWLRDLIDQVLVMDQGRIAEQIPFQQLDDDTLRARYGLRNTTVHDRRNQLSCVTSHTGAISVSGLTFAYQGKTPLFTDFTVALPKGMVIGIIGDNGVGKTTFARLITGLLPMQHGTICIDGKPVNPQRADAPFKHRAAEHRSPAAYEYGAPRT
jgi:energy-coupling factor transport system ATP-binding protein